MKAFLYFANYPLCCKREKLGIPDLTGFFFGSIPTLQTLSQILVPHCSSPKMSPSLPCSSQRPETTAPEEQKPWVAWVVSIVEAEDKQGSSDNCTQFDHLLAQMHYNLQHFHYFNMRPGTGCAVTNLPRMGGSGGPACVTMFVGKILKDLSTCHDTFALVQDEYI